MLINRTTGSAGIVPELVYPDVAQAVDWLCGTFGFTEAWRAGGHRARVTFGNGVVIIADSDPGYGRTAPGRGGRRSHAVMVKVDDVDAHHDHAARHGARILSPPADTRTASGSTQPKTWPATTGRSLRRSPTSPLRTGAAPRPGPRLASSQDCSRPVAVVTVVCHEACRLPPPGPGPPARRAQHAQARAGLVHSPAAGALRRRLPGAGIRAGVASPGAPAIPLSPEGGNQRSREAAGTPIRPRAQPPICTARARAVREVVRRRTGCSARFRHAGRGKPRHAVAVILRHA
jgi:uncharacterized glyoxalase superfamily protein PhnB